jgi:hypothetical protein
LTGEDLNRGLAEIADREPQLAVVAIRTTGHV